MVTVTVMGVLVGMSAPHFTRSIEQSRADFAVANLRAIWAAEKLYWLEHKTYTDNLAGDDGLCALRLLDPTVVSNSDYDYSVTSFGASTFSAQAARKEGTGWTGTFTIDQTGVVSGAISAADQPSISAGFQ